MFEEERADFDLKNSMSPTKRIKLTKNAQLRLPNFITRMKTRSGGPDRIINPRPQESNNNIQEESLSLKNRLQTPEVTKSGTKRRRSDNEGKPGETTTTNSPTVVSDRLVTNISALVAVTETGNDETTTTNLPETPQPPDLHLPHLRVAPIPAHRWSTCSLRFRECWRTAEAKIPR